MTEEGKIKEQVKKMLKHFGAYFEMPVPGGYGKSGLDFNVCYRGFWLSIETKAPGKKLTPRQEATVRRIREAAGVALVVDGPQGLDHLKTFLIIAGLTDAATAIKVAAKNAEDKKAQEVEDKALKDRAKQMSNEVFK